MTTDVLPGLDLAIARAPKARVPTGPRSAAGRVRKGARVEREIADLHRQIGIRAVKVPLSGAAGRLGGTAFSGDLKLHLFGEHEDPLSVEVKSRATGGGFATIERWLGDQDALVLKRDRQSPLIVLPWRTWARLLAAVRT